MPDLLTHLAAARLPAACLRDRRLAALLVIGTFLPDIAAKGLYWVLKVPDLYDTPTHTLIGVLLISYAASLFLEERLRKAGFVALAVGGVIHVGVDMLKMSFGVGGAYFFYPFSTWHDSIELIDPINVTVLLPFDLAILAVAWVLERRLLRVR